MSRLPNWSIQNSTAKLCHAPGRHTTDTHKSLSSGPIKCSRLTRHLFLALAFALPGAAETLYTNSTANRILAFTAANTTPVVFANPSNGISAPRGIAFDAAGNLYVELGGNEVRRFASPALGTASGTGVTFSHFSGGSQGIDVSSTGTIGSAAFTDRSVRLQTTGGTQTRIGVLPAPWDIEFNASNGFWVSTGSNQGMTIGSDGNIYVSARGGTLRRYNAAGTLVTSFSVVNLSGTAVRRYSPTGVDLGTYASGFTSAFDLAFDSGGNLYVADDGSGRIFRVTAPGVSTVYQSGLSGVRFLAFGPDINSVATPEPGTLLSFAGGLALIFAARRRKNRPAA